MVNEAWRKSRGNSDNDAQASHKKLNVHNAALRMHFKYSCLRGHIYLFASQCIQDKQNLY